MLMIPVSPGELLDKVSILEIKLERVSDVDKRRNVETELALLRPRCNEIVANARILELVTRLKRTNQALWDIEDSIRAYEATGDFDKTFITLARSVYKTNDARSMIKKEINQLLRSHIVEEKSYAHC